jgi:hypothetical protein
LGGGLKDYSRVGGVCDFGGGKKIKNLSCGFFGGGFFREWFKLKDYGSYEYKSGVG